MHKRLVVAALSSIAMSTSAQTELLLDLCEYTFGKWIATARLVDPEHDILAVITDLGFTMSGEGFSNFNYNPAFDSDFFGPADVEITNTELSFLGGNTIPPLNNDGGPDSSNPLHLFTVEATAINRFDIVGYFGGAYVDSPFPDVFTYQTASGMQGEVPYEIRMQPFCVPSPGAVTVIGLTVPFALRRRR